MKIQLNSEEVAQAIEMYIKDKFAYRDPTIVLDRCFVLFDNNKFPISKVEIGDIELTN
jgi:hypothetical protein